MNATPKPPPPILPAAGVVSFNRRQESVLVVATHYAKDQYVTSFAGYFPAENPKFVGVVVVDRATVDEEINYGGLVAAPIFSRIVSRFYPVKITPP